MNQIFLFLLILTYFVYFSSAYYGDPKNGGTNVKGFFGNALVTIGENIYSLGGKEISSGERYASTYVTVYNFTSDGILQEELYEYGDSVICELCQGYVLPDNKTIVVIGLFGIDGLSDTLDERYTISLGFFDTASMTWLPTDPSVNDTLLPTNRQFFSSAISPNGDTLYLIGGVPYGSYTPTGILRYDLVNRASIVDLSIANPLLNFTLMGASTVMLPNGVAVIAFGSYSDIESYNTSEVLLFNTNTNEIRVQPVNGIAPKPRESASSTLGPDKTTIYYFGGQDLKNSYNPSTGVVYNDLVILDTSTWSWITSKITGITPMSVVLAGMTVIDDNEIFISTGIAYNYVTTLVSVLKNVPGPGESIESSNLQWFTNYEIFDNPNYHTSLSNGAIAGIVIGILAFVSIIIILLWRYVPATKRIAIYIQNDVIWNPRSGEPLWAETSRLLVRFILLVLFLSFVVYVIYRSIESPIVSQEIVEPTNSVRFPDVRFCFDGFNEENFKPEVSCIFRNGTSCSDKIEKLDKNKHSPVYADMFGNISCLMMIPGPDFYIVNDNMGYTDSSGTKIQFSFLAEPQFGDNIDWGVIYIDFYAPEHNPNFKAQGWTNDTNFSEDYYRKWKIEEQSSNLVDSIILKQGVESTASYTLSTIKKLRKDDGWNYIGFSSSYDDSMDVEAFYKDSPQNPNNWPRNVTYNSLPVSILVVQPKDFVLTTKKDQKVFTLLNAFAQAGGVLGLFVAVQTLLFGFRPQSPWGIVHRWSFGSLRIKLTDRLANYFNKMGTPVPLVNPVSTRISNINGHGHFNNSEDTYIPYGPDVPSAVDESAEQGNRMHRMEERLQLMEVLLKSYYLNDEIFKSLDIAVKRGREERRRSSLGNSRDKDTDSVLENDVLNREFEGGLNRNLDDGDRPSPSVFQMQPRGTYRTNLTSQGPLEVYDEDLETGKT